jgi:hypothetical protein
MTEARTEGGWLTVEMIGDHLWWADNRRDLVDSADRFVVAASHLLQGLVLEALRLPRSRHVGVVEHPVTPRWEPLVSVSVTSLWRHLHVTGVDLVFG